VSIPNLLTILRIAALPVIITLFRTGRHVSAAAVFFVVMLTDCVDGWLARKLNQQTTLGLYLDPVVDKIVLIVLLYELARAGLIDTAIAYLFLARELLQNAVRAVAALGGEVVGANWMGKTKAAFQTGLITVGLALPGFSGPGERSQVLFAVSAWALLALTWCFFGMFACRNRKALSIQTEA